MRAELLEDLRRRVEMNEVSSNNRLFVGSNCPPNWSNLIGQ